MMHVTCFRVLSFIDGWNTIRALAGRESSCDESSTKSASSPPPSMLASLARTKSRVKKKTVPLPSSDLKSMLPPMHSMMALVMTRPRPVPFSFAVL